MPSPAVASSPIHFPAPSKGVKEVGAYQSWHALVADDVGGMFCYIVATPDSSAYSQTVAIRDPVFFMVTSVPARKIRNEVSTIMGYAFGPNATVQLDIDGFKYNMFTANTDTAWALPSTEASLVEQFKAGTRLVVVGRSKNGITTTDTYSLDGFTAALLRMAQECPV
jgi:hypothetical protein